MLGGPGSQEFPHALGRSEPDEWDRMAAPPSLEMGPQLHGGDSAHTCLWARGAAVLCQVASVVSDSLQSCGLWPAGLLGPWGFSRQEH